MKINKILKKYKQLNKDHVEGWKRAVKRINDGKQTYEQESYNYQLEGNRLFESLMKELEGHEIFPKKQSLKPINPKK